MSEKLENIIEQLKRDKIFPEKFLERIIATKNINFEDEYGCTALLYTVYKGDLGAVKKLVKLGADVNKDIRDSNTILHIAAGNNHLEIVKYLLEEMNPPLLAEFCDRTNKDGETVLHAAVYAENPEVLKVLLKNNFFKNKINDEDYYGWKAIDIACGFKNDDSVRVLLGNENLTAAELEKLPHYGEPLKDISQGILNKKLIKFLTLTGRDGAEIMDSEGYCSGWEFLYQISKNRNEFFEILNLLENWDGEDESLRNTKLPIHLEKKYKKIFSSGIEEPGSLLDVFEQLANDLIFFQTGTEAANELNLNLRERIKQFELLKNKSDNRKLERLGFFNAKLNKAQLIEILELFSRYRGASIDVGGEEHATALHVSEEGNFVLDYYDSNARNRLKLFVSAESLADYIIKSKYKPIVRNYKPSEPIDIEFSMFKIYNDSRNIPNTEKTFPLLKPLNNSANQFSELHYAVMENDTEKVRKLSLNKEENNIDAKDAHGISVLERALSMGNNEIINCLVESIDADTLINSFDWKNVEASGKIESVIEIIFKKINPSDASEFETKILKQALQTKSIDLMNILLDRGVLINNDNLMGNENIENLMGITTEPNKLIKFFNHENNRLDFLDLPEGNKILVKIMYNNFVQKLIKKNNTKIIEFISKLIENGAELDPTNVLMLREIFSNEKLADAYKKYALKKLNDYIFSKFFTPSTNKILDRMEKKIRLNIMIFLLEMEADLAYASYLSLAETVELNKGNPSNTAIEKRLATKIRWDLQSFPLDLTELKKFLTEVPELAKTTVIPLMIKYLNGAKPAEKMKLIGEFKKSDNELLKKITNELDEKPITYDFSSQAKSDEKDRGVIGHGQNKESPKK